MAYHSEPDYEQQIADLTAEVMMLRTELFNIKDDDEQDSTFCNHDFKFFNNDIKKCIHCGLVIQS